MFSACDVHLHHLGTTQCHHPQKSAVYLCHQAPHLPELPAVTEAFVPLFLTVSSWRNPFKSSYRICLLAINALILFAWGCLHFFAWCSEEMSPVICIFLPLKIITPVVMLTPPPAPLQDFLFVFHLQKFMERVWFVSYLSFLMFSELLGFGVCD